MKNRQNPFEVGQEAVGESFIGRREYLDELRDAFFESHSSIHLVGITRVGKSSLVARVLSEISEPSDHIIIRMNLAAYDSAFGFWGDLFRQICDELQARKLWDPRLERCYQEYKGLSEMSNWYMPLNSALKKVLQWTKKKGQYVVLLIDEFDSVTRVFEGKAAYYQFLRDIYSAKSIYNVCGALISRRRLEVLEVKVDSVSTLHGVFRDITLYGFDEKDMEEYYRLLGTCGVTISEDGKARIAHFTGNIPYLCCRFAHRLVQKYRNITCDRQVVDQVFRDNITEINSYYDDLIRRLAEDKHIETLLHLAFNFVPPALKSERIKETMISMGCLNQGKEGELYRYYAYSYDFMEYLKLQPLNLPLWDLLTSCEKHLKKLIVKKYPELNNPYQKMCDKNGATSYCEGLSDYKNMGLYWGEIYKCCDALSAHKQNPAVVDGITLGGVNYIITKYPRWESVFKPYFNGEDSWKKKLEEIGKIRNPVAHAHEEDIDEQRKAVCCQYCQELLNLQF